MPGMTRLRICIATRAAASVQTSFLLATTSWTLSIKLGGCLASFLRLIRKELVNPAPGFKRSHSNSVCGRSSTSIWIRSLQTSPRSLSRISSGIESMVLCRGSAGLIPASPSLFRYSTSLRTGAWLGCRTIPSPIHSSKVSPDVDEINT
jgi:hypothetical protein